MFAKFIFVCALLCFVQNAFGQAIGCGNGLINNGIGLNSYNGLSLGNGLNGNLAANGFAGNLGANLIGLNGQNLGGQQVAGYGDVAVAGELPIGGNTAIAGNLPVIGYVTFEGNLPAGGLVSLASNCGCK